MARDRDILPDKEWFEKTTSIVEEVRDCKVDITYLNKPNQVEDKNRNTADKEHDFHFRLNIATPAVKGIEKFTGLNHELGHILMETPMAEARKILDKWTKDENKNWLKSNGQKRYTTYWTVFNVLEDQRIESMMGRLWLANKDRFVKARKNRGKLHKTCPDNPIDILLNIRFFREDLVENKKNKKELKQALEDVVETGRMGALIVLANLKPIIDSYFTDSKPPEKIPPVDLAKVYLTPTDKTENAKIAEQIIEEHKQTQDDHKPTEDDGSDSNGLSNWDNSQKERDEVVDDIAGGFKGDSDDDSDYQDQISDQKIEGDSTIDDIKDTIAGDGSHGEITPSYVLRINRQKEGYSINKEVSEGLKKVFKKVAEIPKTTIGYDGQDIDIETYIENKMKGGDITKCFIDKRYAQGVSIVISIDGSASMNGYPINTVRDLVATLYDSVKHYPNVNMKANVWSSNNKGDVGITDINGLEDCNRISVWNDSGCGQTPTHLALDYSARQVKKMKGRKKLVILITDGLPNYSNNNFRINRTTLMKMSKKAFLKLRRSTPHVMVILVGGRYGGEWYMEQIFGLKRLMHVDSIGMAADRVIKEFKSLVIKSLK